jgi:hypothetical protein
MISRQIRISANSLPEKPLNCQDKLDILLEMRLSGVAEQA